MKKIATLFCAGLVTLAFPIFAQDMKTDVQDQAGANNVMVAKDSIPASNSMGMQQNMPKKGFNMNNMNPNMDMQKMMERHKMMCMMGMMMKESMVATPDGGVIVLVGHKRQKYDKDLNLIKEVQIPFR